MLAQPATQLILDNVTEALHALSAEYQKSDLTKRVVEHYVGSGSCGLEKTKAADGFYRWGSDWLSEKEFGKIQAGAESGAGQDRFAPEGHGWSQGDLIKLDRQIADDKQIQQAIASQSVQMDPFSGRTYAMPLPQRYYDLDRDIRSMQAEEVQKQKEFVDLQRLQQQQSKLMPVAHYSGLQKPFDVESMPGGTPMSASITPATPTTAPAEVMPAAHNPPSAPQPPKGNSGGAGGVDFGSAPVGRSQ